MWGKSIQGRGSACAKARKRESGACGHQKTVFGVLEMRSGQQGPDGWVESGLLGRRRAGENAQTQQWWTCPARRTEQWLSLTSRGRGENPPDGQISRGR